MNRASQTILRSSIQVRIVSSTVGDIKNSNLSEASNLALQPRALNLPIFNILASETLN